MRERTPETIVVVGTSLAGLRAVEALRRDDYPGRIVAIGAEPHLPYDRPPLSKQFLKGDWDEDRLALRRDGVEELDVDWRLGVGARALDVAGRAVELEGGERVAYDRVLIATGSVARSLPFGEALGGVHVLRSLEDSRGLRDDLSDASQVLIVGAGFIGMEVAATCRQRGLAVTVVEPLAEPLIRGLGAELGAWVGARHAEEGVTIRCGVGVEGFEGNRRVERAKLTDGTSIEADVVVVGIGARPATEWIESSGVELEDGVVCDAAGATSAPNVFAAGDCARWQGVRLEHWTNAVEQGTHVAARMLRGESAGPLEHLPYVWTDQFELRLQIAGQIQPGDAMHVCHGSLDPEGERRFVALFGREGRLVGAVGNKRPRQLIAVRKLLSAGASFAEALSANA
jgi:3-phenylpropionate/trans-cinnamate dioxygenase ferredoxin reductase subunit